MNLKKHLKLASFVFTNYYKLFFHKLIIITNNKQLSIGKFNDEMMKLINTCLIKLKITIKKTYDKAMSENQKKLTRNQPSG
jgi:hypothetical protein